MGRAARDRFLIAWLCFAGACGGSTAAPDAGPSLAITAPDGLGELVPGGTLAIGWTLEGAFTPADLSVELQSREDGTVYSVVSHGMVDAGDQATATGFTWAGSTTDGQVVAPGFYDLFVDMGDVMADGGDTHVVVMQGLAFTSPAAGGATLHVSQAAPASLAFDTATTGTFDASFSVTRAGTQTPTPIHMTTVPGELHSVSRQLTWDGTDATGAPLADGTYVIGAAIVDEASGLGYTATGGDVAIP